MGVGGISGVWSKAILLRFLSFGPFSKRVTGLSLAGMGWVGLGSKTYRVVFLTRRFCRTTNLNGRLALLTKQKRVLHPASSFVLFCFLPGSLFYFSYLTLLHNLDLLFNLLGEMVKSANLLSYKNILWKYISLGDNTSAQTVVTLGAMTAHVINISIPNIYTTFIVDVCLLIGVLLRSSFSFLLPEHLSVSLF